MQHVPNAVKCTKVTPTLVLVLEIESFFSFSSVDNQSKIPKSSEIKLQTTLPKLFLSMIFV